MINILNKIKLIFFYPFNLILGLAVTIYFYKIFKKDLRSNPEYDSSFNVFAYFQKYLNEIVLYAQEWSKKLFVIKYIFSIVFWSIIYQIIYLLIN
jgi:hypothetical protein